MTKLTIFVIFYLIISINGAYLNCDYSYEEKRGSICNATRFESSQIDQVCGKSRPKDDINFLQIASKTLKFIPKGIKEHFPHLAGLRLDFDNLVEITQDDLKDFGDNLEYLSITKSKIQVFPSNLFKSTKNIHTLYLDSSELKSIEEGTFDGLDLLGVLSVRFPTCRVSDDFIGDQVQGAISSIKNRCFNKTVKFEKMAREDVTDDGDLICEGMETSTKSPIPVTDSSNNSTVIPPNAEDDKPPKDNTLTIVISTVIILIVVAIVGIFVMKKIAQKRQNADQPVKYNAVGDRT